MGMTQKDFKRPEFPIWEELWDIVMLFSDNMTQWRTGPNGVVGLDYRVFYRYFDRHGVSSEEEDTAMFYIRTMEDQVLSKQR